MAPEVQQPSENRQASDKTATIAWRDEETGLTKEQIKELVQSSEKLGAAFGEVVSLMMRTPAYANMPLRALDPLVLPGLVNGQFLIARAQSKSSGLLSPAGAILWAMVSEEVDERLSNPDNPQHLKRNEWRGGETPWLMITAGDERAVSRLVVQAQKTILKDQAIKVRIKGADEKIVVSEIRPNPVQAE